MYNTKVINYQLLRDVGVDVDAGMRRPYAIKLIEYIF